MINPRFSGLIIEALREFTKYGYRNEQQLQSWLERLQVALHRELPTDAVTRTRLRSVLGSIFNRTVTAKRGMIQERVPGVQRYTVDKITPALRLELDQRIFAGVDLIRLNRQKAVQSTLSRFAGWVTSTPPDSMKRAKVRDEAARIAKPVRQLRYEQRRVEIDQGHKLNAAIAHVVAKQEGAIAAIWHDRGQYDHGYDARPEHLKRSKSFFFIRDGWGMQQGLLKRGAVKYTDEIEQPAELPFCSCWYEYVTAPQDLPDAMLTRKGRAWTANTRMDSSIGLIDRRRIHGFPIVIETRKGQERYGCTETGARWSVTMPADYGYFDGIMGADGDMLDVYLGDNPHRAQAVYVIEQHHLEGGFDEEKVMVGFDRLDHALEVYVLGFSDGKGGQRIGGAREMSWDEFRKTYPRAA